LAIGAKKALVAAVEQAVILLLDLWSLVTGRAVTGNAATCERQRD
jgi:hypothetical protein